MKLNRILSIGIGLLIAVMSQAQGKRMAVVETSACYMRIAPDYESALETQELMGTVVEIVGENGYWREIVSPQPYKAWATEKTLVEMSEEQIKEYEKAPKYIFTELYGHLYMEPAEKAQTICDLVGGDVMRISLKETDAGRGQTDSEGRKVKAAKPVTRCGWAQVILPSGKTGWVQKNTVKPLEERIDIRMGDTSSRLICNEKMEAIIASAHQLLGVPYLWGGMTSKGVDCSGLVRISAIMNGVLLPRNASQMIKCGIAIDVPPLLTAENGLPANASDRVQNLKRGDLVFFGTPATAEMPMRVTHVGIYLGNSRIIHSSHKVRVNSLNPDDSDYYENAHRLIAACRLAN